MYFLNANKILEQNINKIPDQNINKIFEQIAHLSIKDQEVILKELKDFIQYQKRILKLGKEAQEAYKAGDVITIKTDEDLKAFLDDVWE